MTLSGVRVTSGKKIKDFVIEKGIQFYRMMNTNHRFRWNHLTSFAEHGGPNKSFRPVRKR
jgi:hypothetical protein